MNQETINSIYNLLPEATLAVFIIVITSLSSFLKKDSRALFIIFLSGLLISFTFLLTNFISGSQILFDGLLTIDPFSYYSGILLMASAIIICAAFYRDSVNYNEYILFLLFQSASLISVSSGNIILTFVSLETAKISLYILLSQNKKLAIKFFIYSSITSGIMLYGFSLLYGITGETNYSFISEFLSGNVSNNLTLAISIIFITIGLVFNMIVMPLNFIFPSIAENTKLKNAAILSVISVIAGFTVSARFFLGIFHDTNSFITDNETYTLIKSVNWQLMLAIISAVSIIFGNFVILWQKNLRKVFSFIIIAQTGYLLQGIASASPSGLQASMIYLFSYVINTLGLIISLKIIEEKFEINDIDSLAGFGKTNKLFFTIFSLFIISAAGIPLTIGFIGKLLIFKSIALSDYTWVIPIGILCVIVYLYFAFRFIYALFISKNSAKSIKIETNYYIILLFLSFIAVLSGIYFGPLFEFIKYCSKIYSI